MAKPRGMRAGWPLGSFPSRFGSGYGWGSQGRPVPHSIAAPCPPHLGTCPLRLHVGLAQPRHPQQLRGSDGAALSLASTAPSSPPRAGDAAVAAPPAHRRPWGSLPLSHCESCKTQVALLQVFFGISVFSASWEKELPLALRAGLSPVKGSPGWAVTLAPPSMW